MLPYFPKDLNAENFPGDEVIDVEYKKWLNYLSEAKTCKKIGQLVLF